MAPARAEKIAERVSEHDNGDTEDRFVDDESGFAHGLELVLKAPWIGERLAIRAQAHLAVSGKHLLALDEARLGDTHPDLLTGLERIGELAIARERFRAGIDNLPIGGLVALEWIDFHNTESLGSFDLFSKPFVKQFRLPCRCHRAPS
jgi:hypothetical protein